MLIALQRTCAALLCLGVAASTLSCQPDPTGFRPRAYRVSDRGQLIGGGPRALGEVGDYMLDNDRIRVVVQNAGYSRGFGVYGGGIIDADIRRFDEQGRNESNRKGGHDIFAEMFPSFFFQAVACDKVEVLSDGSKPYDQSYGPDHVHYDAGIAVVRASGGGGEFLMLLKVFNSLFLNYLLPTTLHTADGSSELLKLGLLLNFDFSTFASELNKITNENARYEVDYVLKPGANHIEIHARIINDTARPLRIPSAVLGNPTFQAQIGGVDLSPVRVPLGSVLLYGRLNNVWLPGTGFDLRHPLDRSFRRSLPLPAFSGVVTEFLASASYRQGDRVSYGLAAAPSDTNFVSLNADLYRSGGAFKDTFTPIDTTSLLVPFTAISFIGVFSDSIQTTIPSHGFVEMTQYFIVGGGDVAAITDEVASLRGQKTGRYQGQLLSNENGQPARDAQVLIYQQLPLTTAAFARDDDYLDAGLRRCGMMGETGLCRPYSQDYPDDAGFLSGRLPPGRYAYRVQAEGRALGAFVPFEIKEGETTRIDPIVPLPSYVQALVVDQQGRAIPAKVTVVGRYDRDFTDAQRRSGGVFDLQAGESYRYSDMLPDKVDGQRRYIEATGYTNATGHVTLAVRPGDYTVYFSRGLEYDLTSTTVRVTEGNVASVSGQVTRVVDTSGWMSMDGHVHSENSVDSHMDLPERVLSAAGEGIDIAISTDHNFVSDWRPMVDHLELRPWLTSFVGMEFTTLESGHFNTYPLDYQVAPVTHGAFEWFGRPPADLFTDLRKLGDRVAGNIIVCNHPRDAQQGYFNQYGRSSITGGTVAQGTSKRLAGPNGPAFFDGVGQSLISYDCDALELVNGKLQHELHSIRVPADWPAACYQPLPPGFDPKKQLDPCSANGKVLRPASITGALVPGQVLVDLAPSAPPGETGLDNLEAVFPGAIDDWFHMLNQGYRHTALAASDSHGSVGEEPGWPRTYLQLGSDDPVAASAEKLVDAVKVRRAVTLSNGPFLTFTVAPGSPSPANPGLPIGSELYARDGHVTVSYKLSAAPWVSVSRIHVWVNGRLQQKIPVDPSRSLADTAQAPSGPVVGQVSLSLPRDAWIVLEAAGEKPMFPVITGTEEPFLLVSDAVGALAGPLGIAATTDISAVVVGNPAPYALTNPVWVRTGDNATWQPPGVVPWAEINTPAQDPQVGVLRSRNH